MLRRLEGGTSSWPGCVCPSVEQRNIFIYYSRYSTPYLSGEGEEGGLGGGSCGVRTRDVVIRRYRTTGIYTFG